MCGQTGNQEAKKPATAGQKFPLNTTLKSRGGAEVYLFEYNEENKVYFGRYRYNREQGWAGTYWYQNGRYAHNEEHRLDILLPPVERTATGTFYLLDGKYESFGGQVTVLEHEDHYEVSGNIAKF